MTLRNVPAQKVPLKEDKHYSFIIWSEVGFLIFIIKVLLRAERRRKPALTA